MDRVFLRREYSFEYTTPADRTTQGPVNRDIDESSQRGGHVHIGVRRNQFWRPQESAFASTHAHFQEDVFQNTCNRKISLGKYGAYQSGRCIPTGWHGKKYRKGISHRTTYPASPAVGLEHVSPPTHGIWEDQQSLPNVCSRTCISDLLATLHMEFSRNVCEGKRKALVSWQVTWSRSQLCTLKTI